jgi:general secretion pathway protein G
LIELLVVMAIVALLLAIAAPRYFNHVDRAREAALRQTLTTVRDAIDKYHADTDAWPQDLQQLVDKRYLRALPRDPLADEGTQWQIVPPPGGEEQGVWDIHSMAPGTAGDGTAYAEW